MKIRLTCDVPVGLDQGLVKGRVLEVLRPNLRKGLRELGSKNAVVVQGDASEVTVWRREYEVVSDAEPT